ncbi:hypothetical protein HW561_01315 [Rhodobacteraceae bacterium B1Z28]|uniref:Uncharacterized protein n=1 Tax=Ruegeria haliotis TaxID=2747601 RepID=A0ABX2PJY2_9RHOB|nr:hypothetical protein [Ruegeria haliotis]NVO54428.1 hypothetical protein [Ruegeria haliotis]
MIVQDLPEWRQRVDAGEGKIAFSEMAAFSEFMKLDTYSGVHLMNFSKSKAFDDAVALGAGYAKSNLRNGQEIKDLFYHNGRINARRGDQCVEFVTMNMSWLPICMYFWVLQGAQTKTPHMRDF